MQRRKVTHYQLAIEHSVRMQRKKEKIEMIQALMATWEEEGNMDEVRRLTIALRTAKQELRYMDK
jgi:hypothetical protein